MPISARNQIKGVGELGLAEGREVTAIVKASDVIVATDI